MRASRAHEQRSETQELLVYGPSGARIVHED